MGLSDKPRRKKYLITEQAEAQIALLKARGITDIHILAHDYGVTVSQELLARQAEGALQGITLKSIVFLNGGLYPDMHRARPIQKLLAGPFGPLISRFMSQKRFAKSFSEIFGSQTQPSAEELDAFWGADCTRRGHAGLASLA